MSIIPVLLGADLNCYSMARAFYEAYGVKSFAFAKCNLGAIRFSRFIKFEKIPPLSEKNAVLSILFDFASACENKPYIFGCTDEYALFIIENKDILSKFFICPCPDKNKVGLLSEKTRFYEFCKEIHLPYPEYEKIKSPSR